MYHSGCKRGSTGWGNLRRGTWRGDEGFVSGRGECVRLDMIGVPSILWSIHKSVTFARIL
jgi:hypothetical protein